MKHTNWKQDFYSRIEPIAMRDPLAAVLGATEDGETIYYYFTDCVKLAGHACASVSCAFEMTRLALKELYCEDTPERGGIEVRFAGDAATGANGPIGQVIQFITGAAAETGFHGLGGKYGRDNRFIFDETIDRQDAPIAARFKRTDTGEEVAVRANPGRVPMTDEEIGYSGHMQKVVANTASPDEREKFYIYWQGKNRKILLDNVPGVFTVERIRKDVEG